MSAFRGTQCLRASARMASDAPKRQLTGVVVSQGKMIRTVKVRIAKREWNKKIQKWYANPKTLMVSDPTSSTREGDVVILEGGRRISRNVRHVVAGVLAPMGPPMSERNAIPSAVERLAAVEAKRAAKDIRQAARGRWPAIVRVREREARATAGGELEFKGPPRARTLEAFVRKRREESLWPPPLGNFLESEIYAGIEWEFPLKDRPARMLVEREKLREKLAEINEKMEKEDQFEREQSAKERLKISQAIEHSGRSRHRFEDYLKEVEELGRRGEFYENPKEFFAVVKALSMDEREKAVCAVDLWGKTFSQQLYDEEQSAREAARRRVLEASAAFEQEALKTQEEEAEALADTLKESRLDSESPAIAALDVQDPGVQPLETGAKELTETDSRLVTGLPEAQQAENARKAQGHLGTGLENEEELGREEGKDVPGEVEKEEPAEKTSGGFFGLFKKR